MRLLFLDGLCRGRKPLRRKALKKKGNVHALQALFLLRRRLLLVRGLLQKSCTLRLLLLIPSLQEGRLRRGGPRDAPCAASCEASSPPARPRSSERGGSVSGHSSGAHKRAPPSSAPSGAGEGGAARAASSVASPSSSLHALRRGESGVSSRSAPVRDPLVFPNLRIEEQGRIVEPALGRAAPVAGLGDLALAPLPARGQAIESVVAGTRLGRCPPTCGRGHLTAIGRIAFALAQCLGEVGRGLRIATALVGIAIFKSLPVSAGAFAIPCSSGRLP